MVHIFAYSYTELYIHSGPKRYIPRNILPPGAHRIPEHGFETGGGDDQLLPLLAARHAVGEVGHRAELVLGLGRVPRHGKVGLALQVDVVYLIGFTFVGGLFFLLIQFVEACVLQ